MPEPFMDEGLISTYATFVKGPASADPYDELYIYGLNNGIDNETKNPMAFLAATVQNRATNFWLSSSTTETTTFDSIFDVNDESTGDRTAKHFSIAVDSENDLSFNKFYEGSIKLSSVFSSNFLLSQLEENPVVPAA